MTWHESECCETDEERFIQNAAWIRSFYLYSSEYYQLKYISCSLTIICVTKNMCYKIAEKIDESTAYKNVTHSNQKPNILPLNLHKKSIMHPCLILKPTTISISSPFFYDFI